MTPSPDSTATVHRATRASLEELAHHQSECFAGYLLPVPPDAVALADRIRCEHIDLHHSFEMYNGGTLVAQAFIARRNEHSRVASMGVPPPARGKGWGRAAIQICVSEARQRGDLSLQLEVITTNTSATTLYKDIGFTTTRRLHGYELGTGALASRAPAPASLTTVDEAAHRIASAREGLPWQLEGATIASLDHSWTALSNGPGILVYRSSGTTLTLRAVHTHPAHRRQGHARQLLTSLAARHPEALLITLPAIAPADAADPLARRLGALRTALTQDEMRIQL